MPQKTASFFAGLIFCLTLAAFGPALAATTDSAAPEIDSQAAARAAAQQKRNALRVELQVGTVGKADIKGGPAELGYSEFRANARYKGFDAGYELRDYTWSRTDGLPFAPGWRDPFNEMHTLWLGYEHRGRINRRWGWRAYGRVSSSFEDDIPGLPNALLGAGVSYAPGNGFIIMAGLFASYNEADQFYLPYAGLVYRPLAKDGFSGSLGFPFSRLSYHLTQKLTLTMRTGFIRRTYKLADDNPVESKGDFRTSEFSGGLGSVTPSPKGCKPQSARITFSPAR